MPRRRLSPGAQAAGAAPLVHGAPVAAPETEASAIRVGNPATWGGAVAARDRSRGLIAAVSALLGGDHMALAAVGTDRIMLNALRGATAPMYET